jgi:hypothetical protein
MTNAAEANPFREAAQTAWLAAEHPDLAYEERERLQRQALWYEQEAARWDVRRGLVPTSPEPLPRCPASPGRPSPVFRSTSSRSRPAGTLPTPGRTCSSGWRAHCGRGRPEGPPRAG